jgi:TRAP-type C4-dicarboxylate transport system substrate-binding protein
MTPQEVYNKLSAGEFEMSQMYTTSLGTYDKSLWVLDMPFLFRNHEHATKVLEGKVGQKLLASLEKNKLSGLAFTYSGGFRVLSSTDKKLSKIEDFKGIRVRTTESPVAQATFRQLKATPVGLSLEDGKEGLRTGFIQGSETTEARFWDLGENKVAKYLNETEHSLFLTAVVVNKSFMDRLPADQQAAIRKAAFESARVERQVSIQDGEDARKKAASQGVEVVTMSPAERDRMREATKPVYQKFKNYFEPGLIESIQQTQ